MLTIFTVKKLQFQIIKTCNSKTSAVIILIRLLSFLFAASNHIRKEINAFLRKTDLDCKFAPAETTYSQTSVIERFYSRPNRFLPKKIRDFDVSDFERNLDHYQTERMQTD